MNNIDIKKVQSYINQYISNNYNNDLLNYNSKISDLYYTIYPEDYKNIIDEEGIAKTIYKDFIGSNNDSVRYCLIYRDDNNFIMNINEISKDCYITNI